jgi:hypothetical protein
MQPMWGRAWTLRCGDNPGFCIFSTKMESLSFSRSTYIANILLDTFKIVRRHKIIFLISLFLSIYFSVTTATRHDIILILPAYLLFSDSPSTSPLTLLSHSHRSCLSWFIPFLSTDDSALNNDNWKRDY